MEKFYHGTSEETREKIKTEWCLRGTRETIHGLWIKPSRCTYLTPDIEEAKKYGNIVLEVEYNPYKHRRENNYMPGCWQFRVYEPIQLEHVKCILVQEDYLKPIKEKNRKFLEKLDEREKKNVLKNI